MGCGERKSLELIAEELRRASVETPLSRTQAEAMITEVQKWWPDLVVIFGSATMGQTPQIFRVISATPTAFFNSIPLAVAYSSPPKYRNEHPDMQERFLRFQKQQRIKSAPVNGNKIPRRRFT